MINEYAIETDLPQQAAFWNGIDPSEIATLSENITVMLGWACV